MLMTPLQVHESKGKGAIGVISGKENECTKRIHGVLYIYTYFAGTYTGRLCKTGLLVPLIDPICAYFVCITYVCDRVTIFIGVLIDLNVSINYTDSVIP